MDLKAGKLKSTWSDQTWNYLCFSYWKLHTSLNHTICDQRLIPFKLGIISHVTFNSSVTMIVWIFGRSLRLWGNAMVLDPTVKKTLPHCGSMSLKRDILNFCLILLWSRSKVRKQHRSGKTKLLLVCTSAACKYGVRLPLFLLNAFTTTLPWEWGRGREVVNFSLQDPTGS